MDSLYRNTTSLSKNKIIKYIPIQGELFMTTRSDQKTLKETCA